MSTSVAGTYTLQPNCNANTNRSVPTKDQVLIPESLLKKRKTQEKTQAERDAVRAEKKKASKAKREVIFKRAESYVKEYQDAEREQIRLKRLARKEGNFYVEAQPKIVFVIRIRGYIP
jgi:large subunit ribosomal protein L7e